MRRLIDSALLLLTLTLLNVPVASFAATYTDNFTEASTVNLNLHTPDSGGSWSRTVGTLNMLAQSNDVLALDSADSTQILYVVSWTPSGVNYDVKGTLVTGEAGTADDSFCLIGRYVDTNNYYSACWLRSAEATDMYLTKYVAGVRTDLATGDCDVNVGDVVTLSITDATKKVQINGGDCSGVTSSDNALTAAGQAGVACGNFIAAGSTYDCADPPNLDAFQLVDTAGAGGGSPKNLLLLGVGMIVGVRYFKRGLICLVLVLGLSSESLAANHYIRDGGSASTAGTGACTSWETANACDNLPATLVRGDTYYVATGTYSAWTLSTAPSSTTLITIKGATAADHGADTGWVNTMSVSTADGGSQAIISNGTQNIDITTSYWVVNGNAGGSLSSVSTEYGFLLANGTCSNNHRYMFVHGTSLTTITITKTAIVACAKSNDTSRVNAWGSAGSYVTNFTYSHSYAEKLQAVNSTTNVANSTFEYLYMYDGFSSSANHGENFSFNNCHNSDGGACTGGTTACTQGLCTTNNTIRHNVFRDCPSGTVSGTACIAALDPGNGDSAPNLKIYGNIFWGFPGSGGNGVIATGTSATHYAHNWLIYNNTFVNLSKTIFLPCVSACASSTGNQFYNNILYLSDSTLSGGTIDHNYNAWCSPNDTPPTETNGQTGCGDLFVNAAGGNFHLASATNTGQSLSSPYNQDPDGVTRGSDGTWDRGAYEYGSSPTGGSMDVKVPDAPTMFMVQK